jgi:hypothetical protein
VWYGGKVWNGYDASNTAVPLKVVKGCGSPVNPVVIR